MTAHQTASASSTGSAPIVDISNFRGGRPDERARIARAFGRAFEESGFLTLTGYHIDEALIDATYRAVKTFFALPDDAKLAYALPERTMNRGYLPIGIETVARTLEAQSPPDLCEALVYRSLFQEDRDKANGSEPAWSNLWPDRPEGLAHLITAYYWEMDRLVAELYELSALALDLPKGYFAPFLTDHWNTLRFVNYPDQRDKPLPGQLRYGAHTDYGGLTLVRQDSAPGGLQICAAGGSWHDAPIVAKSFIINVGDLMARWTNDRWRSTLHRVINPSRESTGSTQRLSLVLFSRPDDDAEIAALPTCVSGSNPARYPSVTAGAFTRAKMQKSATR